MKAIVLTYDKYHPVANHMIRKYAELWPDHPFVFRIPYQSFPTELVSEHRERVEPIVTERGIRATVLRLLEDLDDNEWVFWCMDDRYPVTLKLEPCRQIFSWVQSVGDTTVAGILYVKWREWVQEINKPITTDCLTSPSGKKFFRRRNYRMIWMHQYIRVKALRRLFLAFPEQMQEAKVMDDIKDRLEIPVDERLYVCMEPIVGYGESTTRGKLTKNLVESMRQMGMEVPPDFAVSERAIFRGLEESCFSEIKWQLKRLLRRSFRSIVPR